MHNPYCMVCFWVWVIKWLYCLLQARRKGEELKAELSESSKRNSVAAAESGSSKRSSLFSPEGSDGGESPRKLSLKSSAQTVRLLNKARTMVRSETFLPKQWYCLRFIILYAVVIHIIMFSHWMAQETTVILCMSYWVQSHVLSMAKYQGLNSRPRLRFFLYRLT